MEEKEGRGTGSTEEQAVALAHDYLEKFMCEHTHYQSSGFIREALDVLGNVSNQCMSLWMISPLPLDSCSQAGRQTN